ncbi:MAG: hypothetical protein ACLQUY_02890 [Ktedonobacterales bacterium]
MFRKTTMRRAIFEAVAIFSTGQLLAMVPPDVWPAFLDPIVLPVTWMLRLALTISPPVWAAMRVVSTRREKMSRRFWWLGPRLAVYCTLAAAAVALFVGEAGAFGPTHGPDITRLFAHGHGALSPISFIGGQLITLSLLLIYFTIAVICTRLANGGFLRFTMPAGKGRVTL